MDSGQPSNGNNKNDPSPILTNPYHQVSKAAIFREKYKAHIGYTVQASERNVPLLGINAPDVSNAIEGLGFERLAEDMAEHLLPDDEKLSLLLMTSRDNPALFGTGYLTMKPFTSLMYVLCSKGLLVQSLQQAEEILVRTSKVFLTGSGVAFGYERFMLFTMCMDDAQLESILETRPGAYLAKSARAGVNAPRPQLVRIRANHVQEDLLAFLRASQLQSMECSQVILQEYVERPLLVDKRTFDVRGYLLVTNPKRAPGSDGRPRQTGYFAFFHPGFVRLCSAPYDPEAVQPTNQSAQGQQSGDSLSQLKEVDTWYPDELNAYLNKKRRVPQQDWARDVLYPKVGAALGYLTGVFRCRLDDRDFPTSTFRILGVNFMVDERLRVILLEINELPSWARQTSALGTVLPNLWREAACLTSEVTIRYKTYLTVSDDRLVTRQNFRMVYSSEDPYLARRNVTLVYD